MEEEVREHLQVRDMKEGFTEQVVTAVKKERRWSIVSLVHVDSRC